ncbi:hypothetical protein [Oceanobacillus caeni]|uniref:hypothetical protein n=1 Tax=Oceanobacillus caeni TaxID=405946 RepID=UPI00214A14BA|nr:hypothetical protein [Oceanobacillus caeni]
MDHLNMISLNNPIINELVNEGYTYNEVEQIYMQNVNIIDWIIHNKRFKSDKARGNYIKAIILDKLHT